MKPRNKFQQRIVESAQSLPAITPAQLTWAEKHCFDHIAYRTKRGMISCLECGHQWQGENSPLADTLLGCQCPRCATRLQVTTTRQRTLKQIEYHCIITAHEGFQVLRFIYTEASRKVGKEAYFFHKEVVQRWIAPDGKHATLALLRPQFCFADTWMFGSPLELRPDKELYDIMPTRVHPRPRLIDTLRRNGFEGKYHRLTPFELFHALLTDNRAETLLKAKQTALLRYFIRRNYRNIESYWSAIRICVRNNYAIKDASMWCDYIDLLRDFDKDIRNPKYLCPEDLQKEHDRYVRMKERWIERQRTEERKQKALANESRFQELKSRFFGLSFGDGEILIRVLESVQEFFDEGTSLRHCLFTSEYYLRPDSLILSASRNGQRLETIEVSLESLKLLQSRGERNQNSPYHDRIVALVKENIPLIRQRIA